MIKLKGEIIIMAVISIALSWLISITFFSVYRTSDKFDEENYKGAKLQNEKQIEIIKDEVGDSLDDTTLEENMKNLYLNHRNRQYKDLYLIDKEGNVIFKNSNYAITKFSMDDEGIKVNGSEFYATNIIKINDERSIVFLNSEYINHGNRFNMLIIAIFIAFLLFIILIYGRIKYITTISKNVRDIAKGKLDTRIPVKYRNELTTLASDVNFMAEELNNQDNKQKEFITNISHDLRTPLTTIMGYLDMIEEEKYSDINELKRYLSIIRKKSIYLKGMLEDFFMFSKLSSNDMEMNKVSINLNEGIKQLIDGEDEEFKKLDLKLEVDVLSENINTLGDPVLISRAFQNLISNAKKYSKKGSTIYISLSKETIKDSNYTLFQVKNIPDSPIESIDLEKIFYRLYKSDSSRGKGGSGLGLAITKEIVENHQGFIRAEKNNEYLQFSIALKEYVQN